MAGYISGKPLLMREAKLWRFHAWVTLGLATVFVFRPQLAGSQEPAYLEAAVGLEKALTSAIAKGERSVVAIARRPRGQGDDSLLSSDHIAHEFASGVVIDSRGLILTNYHVLGRVESNEYAVWFRRRGFMAKVKGADPWSDLAVLEIDFLSKKQQSQAKLIPMVMGDTQKIRKGQFVISLGNPYAIARDGNVSATWGIVSNLMRKAPPEQNSPDSSGKGTIHHFGTLIQTDARLHLGTSGGALLNLKGEMIGLTTSLAALSGYERSAGFAIPIDQTMQRIINRLKVGAEVQYGFLGVAPESLDAKDRERGLSGIRIGQIVPGTPAAKFGLRFGDLITHIDDRPIRDTDGLILHVSSMPVEKVVRLTVLREDPILHRERILKLEVALSKKHVVTSRPAIVTAERRSWQGMRADFVTSIPVFINRIRDIDSDGCVAVVDVEPDSVAWQSGIRPGVFISHVDDRRVSTPDEFYEAAAKGSSPVRLQFTTRVGEGFTMSIEPR